MKVAVVGLGLMGLLHSRILSSEEAVKSVIGVEVDEIRAEQASAELGIRVVNSLEKVVHDVDAVSITLPDSLHVDAAVTALNAGKYVLVEKPLATNTKDCEKILAAQIAPGRLMVGHILRFDERVRELKRQLENDALGAIHYIRIHRANSMATADRVGRDTSVTAFLGIHDLDLLLWLTGQEIVSGSAQGQRVLNSSWDLSVATLRLSGGTLAQVENHWLLHRASARSCLAGIEVFGDRGTALVDLSTGELELIRDTDPRSAWVDTRNWTHDLSVSGGSLRREVAAFIGAVSRGEHVPISGEEGARAVNALEMVVRMLDDGN